MKDGEPTGTHGNGVTRMVVQFLSDLVLDLDQSEPVPGPRSFPVLALMKWKDQDWSWSGPVHRSYAVLRTGGVVALLQDIT